MFQGRAKGRSGCQATETRWERSKRGVERTQRFFPEELGKPGAVVKTELLVGGLEGKHSNLLEHEVRCS